MPSSRNRGIPFMPSGTLDVAGGGNDAFRVIDAVIMPVVISMALTAPPGSPTDGDCYIVAGTATGAWVGKEKQLTQYVSDGAFWNFYAAATVAIVLNKADGGLYSWDFVSAWQAPIAGASNTNTVTTVTSSSGVVNLDLSLGELFKITLTENITSLTFSNLPGSGKGKTAMLQITQHVSSPKTFAFPSSFKWPGAVTGVISNTNGAKDVLAFTTFDNGTAWDATLAKAFG